MIIVKVTHEINAKQRPRKLIQNKSLDMERGQYLKMFESYSTQNPWISQVCESSSLLLLKPINTIFCSLQISYIINTPNSDSGNIK